MSRASWYKTSGFPRPCGLLAAAFGVLLGCTAAHPAVDSAAQPDGLPRPGTDLSRDFELETLKGDTLRLSEHVGRQVILLDFWATYCGPCLMAMPELERLYRAHRSRGFAVWGVSIDGPDSIARVRSEVARLGVSFPILLDRETRVVAMYNPRTSAPFSVLIGRDGSVLRQKEGYGSGDVEALEREVLAALAAP